MRELWVEENPWLEKFPPFLLAVLGGFFVAHCAIAFGTADLEKSLLIGDRAIPRMEKLQALLNTSSISEMLSLLIAQGSPGDYLLFAPAYALGGAAGVIAQSILLYMVGLYFLYHLARQFFSERIAQIASITYCLLPATIFHPHVLVSETICDPLLIIATYLIARYVTADKPGLADLAIAMILVAVLALVRHVYLFLPIAIAALILFANWRRCHGQQRWLPSFLTLTIGYAVVAAWMAFAALAPVERQQEIPSDGGLEANLYLRIERMAAIGNFDIPKSTAPETSNTGGETHTLSVPTYLSLLAKYPGAYLRTVASDSANIVLNPGVPMVAGRFFGLFDLHERSLDDLYRWRKIRDEQGMLAVALELFRVTPLGFTMISAGLVLWGGLLLLSAFGFLSLLRAASYPLAFRLLIPGLVLYILAVSSIAAGYTRWDHRSPAEFLIAIAFALALVGTSKIPSLAKEARQLLSRGQVSI